MNAGKDRSLGSWKEEKRECCRPVLSDDFLLHHKDPRNQDANWQKFLKEKTVLFLSIIH
jgi:hypothetical protein